VADKNVESNLDNASRIQTLDEAIQSLDAKYSGMITRVKEEIADVAKVADQKNSQTSQRLKTQVTNFETYTSKTNEVLGNLVTKKDIQRIIKRFDDYASYEEIQKFRDDMKPIMDDCQDKLLMYNTQNAQMREAIVRFDEILSEKVNKFALVEFRQEISQSYLKSAQVDELTDLVETSVSRQYETIR